MPLPRLSRLARYRGVTTREGTPEPHVVDDGSRRPYLPPAPVTLPPGGTEEWCARISRTLNRAITGSLNCVSDITLTTGTTTTFYDDRIGYWSAVIPVAGSATAAAAFPTMWFVFHSGSVTINHPAGAADRTLRLVILG